MLRLCIDVLIFFILNSRLF